MEEELGLPKDWKDEELFAELDSGLRNVECCFQILDWKWTRPMNCIKNKKSFFGKHNLENEILLIFMSDAKLKAIPMNT